LGRGRDGGRGVTGFKAVKIYLFVQKAPPGEMKGSTSKLKKKTASSNFKKGGGGEGRSKGKDFGVS